MKKSKLNEKTRILLKFTASEPFFVFKNALSDMLSKKISYLFLDEEFNLLKNKKRQDNDFIDFVKDIVDHNRTVDIASFKCKNNQLCIVIPLKYKDALYGYILAFNIHCSQAKASVSFFKAFLALAFKEFHKGEELTNLYETVRPRAIALSTIHTIHRLLTSTLDMEELIERIARLTLQVMRVKKCSIMFINKPKKCLVAKASIDIANNSKSRKNGKIKLNTKRLECSVAKSGKISFSRNTICVPLVEEDIIGIICANGKIDKNPFNKAELEILVTLAEQSVIALKNARLYEEQNKMAYGSIRTLSALLDAKSPHTYTHSESFVKLTLAIAKEMMLSGEEIRNLKYAVLLPDTGKFSIPDEILKKKTRLSKKEYMIIKKQHIESLKILSPLEFLEPAMPIITYHHERYDGGGYPKGLKGKDIPIGARIMAVADAFEAMVLRKPYKYSKVTISHAIREIKRNKGTQFDPDVVDALMVIVRTKEFKKMF